MTDEPDARCTVLAAGSWVESGEEPCGSWYQQSNGGRRIWWTATGDPIEVRCMRCRRRPSKSAGCYEERCKWPLDKAPRVTIVVDLDQ